MPGENAPVDETGLINPDAFPCKPETLDPETIDSAGKSLRSMGVDIVSRTTAIRESWSRLPAIYESPEQEQVYSLMLKTTIPSFEIRAALVISGSAIQDYASTMATIKKELQDLDKDAREFRKEAQAGYDEQVPDSSVTIPRPAGVGWIGAAPPLKTEKTDWRRHQHAVDKNNEFVAKYNAIYVKIAQAVSECADKINKTDSTVCIPAPPAPTLEELEQMGPMPWGAPGERQAKNCADSFNMGASRFLQEAWDGTKRLAGFDEHGWSIGNTWNTIWSGAVGITDLGTSLVVSVIVTPFIVWGGYKPSEWERERLEVFTRAGSDMVGFDLDAHWAGKDGWHKWTNDPIATATELGLGFFGKAAALKTLGKLGLLPKIPHPATYLRNQIPRFTTGLKNFNASLKDWMHKGNQKILEGIDKLGETADNLANEIRKRHGRQPAYAGAPNNGRRGIANNFDVVHHTADPTPGTGKRSENSAKPRRATNDPHPDAGDHQAHGSDGNDPSTPDSASGRTPHHLPPGTNPDYYPDGLPHPDPHMGNEWTGDTRPGFDKPRTPAPGDSDGGPGEWQTRNRGMSKAAAEYQKHVTGVDHTLNANEKSFAIQEYIVRKSDGQPVDFDGHVWRKDGNGNPQEVFLEAKNKYGWLFGDSKGLRPKRLQTMNDFYDQMTNQLKAMPRGAKLEWHFQEKIVADEVRKGLPPKLQGQVKIYFNPIKE